MKNCIKAYKYSFLKYKLCYSKNISNFSQACSIVQIVKYVVKLEEKGAAVADEVEGLYAGELNPVAPKAQRKVPLPEG